MSEKIRSLSGNLQINCTIIMGGNIVGWEISQTATTKAMKKFPHISFKHKNIMLDSVKNRYELITVSEVMWYLLEKIDEVFDKFYNTVDEN